ncbi:MAG TPA: RDD family protein [Polyangiaceae bacterium]|jgi:uncharacterized RDD family membrane protein YckC
MSNFANPYEPPKSDVVALPDSAMDLIDASSGRRFANLLLDYVGFLVVAVVVALGLELVASTTGVRVPTKLTQLIGMLEWISYYVVFEALLGRTPGKLITGTRVVNLAGGRPRFTQILGRSFARAVPFEAFSFFGSRAGWHDRWSRTRVVLVRR